jgi:hypothetical protein
MFTCHAGTPNPSSCPGEDDSGGAIIHTKVMKKRKESVTDLPQQTMGLIARILGHRRRHLAARLPRGD